ncbi:MAG: cupredoxin domain-containing protein [Actinomycetota bacterium]
MIWRLAATLFTAAFAVRAVRPFVDPTLLAILAAMTIVVVLMWRRLRWAPAVFLLFPVALITTPATADLSFSLVALDSTWWRAHAVASLLLAGICIVGCLVLLADGDERETQVVPGLRSAGLIVVGVIVGLGMIAAVRLLEPVDMAGGDLSAAERDALPKIAMTNFAYAPTPLTVEAGTTYRAMLVNPSDLPHTVTIDEWDVDVYVPAGRRAVLELRIPDDADGTQEFYCAVGDHRVEGMVADLAISPG